MWKNIFFSCLLLSAHLSAEKNVLAFSGSIREASLNKKLVSEAADMARQLDANVTVINLKDFPIPFYDGDIEIKEGMPSKAREIRQLMIQSDVILIASPEYNRSVSGVLKNVIDWASRSEDRKSSRDAFKGKKFIIMSASPGPTGGARGLEHLRAIIDDIGGPGTVLTEQMTVPNAYSAFDENGHLISPQTRSELLQILRMALKN